MQFLRTASSYSTWMPAIDGFDKSHKWSQVSLLFLRALTFESTVTEPSRQLFLSKLSVILSMSFDEEDALLSDKLRAIKELRSSKVGVAFALESTYWKIALSAKANGMIHGWAWIGLNTLDESADMSQLAPVTYTSCLNSPGTGTEPWVTARGARVRPGFSSGAGPAYHSY
jgi:hypothetical protein